jgi:hypothetical protein
MDSKKSITKMKLVSLTFLLLLWTAHGAGDIDKRLGQPLSEFRDSEQGWLGYALFASLLLIGVLYTAALGRRLKAAEAGVSGLAVLLLFVVGTTPSRDLNHVCCSFLLLLLLFGYYAVLLYRAASFWLVIHLVVPMALVLATRGHSYGMWQKSFIVYFVVAAVVHHHLLGREPAKGQMNSSVPRVLKGSPLSKRKIYQVQPGREWARRKVRCG